MDGMMPPEHEMRRKRQQLSAEECKRILDAASSGVLALLDSDGFPYAVPMSFAREGDSLWFHSAKRGHKVSAIASCDQASLCVIEQDEVVPEQFTTYFRSVIAFGHVRIVEDEGARRHALELLADKYSPGLMAERDEEIARFGSQAAIVELSIERLTGKQAKELVGA